MVYSGKYIEIRIASESSKGKFVLKMALSGVQPKNNYSQIIYADVIQQIVLPKFNGELEEQIINFPAIHSQLKQ